MKSNHKLISFPVTEEITVQGKLEAKSTTQTHCCATKTIAGAGSEEKCCDCYDQDCKREFRRVMAYTKTA